MQLWVAKISAWSEGLPGMTIVPASSVISDGVLTISPTSPDEYSDIIMVLPYVCFGRCFEAVLNSVMLAGCRKFLEGLCM